MKYRIVLTDYYDNIIEITKDNLENDDALYDAVLELNKEYHLSDYENCPFFEIQKWDGEEWRFDESITVYWYNL